MIQAILRGKLKDEDILTSTAFGLLLYLEEDCLLKFINNAKNIEGQLLQDEIRLGKLEHVEFWSHKYESIEPDIILWFSETILIIEVKLWSGISWGLFDVETQDGIKETQSGQLSRYYHIINDVEGNNKQVIEIFLTSHPYMPKEEMEEEVERLPKKMRDIFEKRLFWTSWHALHELAETIITSGIAPAQQNIAKDIVKFLENCGLTKFKGFTEAFKSYPDVIFNFQSCLFYSFEEHYYWISIDRFPKIEIMDNLWSYRKRGSAYWIFDKTEKCETNKENIFYKQ